MKFTALHNFVRRPNKSVSFLRRYEQSLTSALHNAHLLPSNIAQLVASTRADGLLKPINSMLSVASAVSKGARDGSLAAMNTRHKRAKPIIGSGQSKKLRAVQSVRKI